MCHTRILLVLAVFASSVSAAVIELQPVRDNTLYEDTAGAVSNGAGDSLFVGANNQGIDRRALLAFDVAGSLPASSVISSATLSLYMSQAPNTTSRNIELRTVSADWGEGTSNATSGGGGSGAPSTTGDATWIHRFYSSALWTNSGGDFPATLSASTPVGGVGSYTWSSPQLTSDVQQWLENPGGNFGWILLGDESTNQTVKRFASRENLDIDSRPSLSIEYTVVPEPATWSAGLLGCVILLALRRPAGTKTKAAGRFDASHTGSGTSF
jgi:hypothetical protein